MRLPLSLILAVQSVLALQPAKRFYQTHDYYVIEHDPYAGASLDEISRALGVEIVEQAGQLVNHWLVRTEKGLRKRDSNSDPVLRSLEAIREQVRAPDNVLARSEDVSQSRRISNSVRVLLPQTLRQRTKRAPPPIRPPPEDIETASAAAQRLDIHDPFFTKQWHLVNDEFPEHMMNVTPVWDMGIKGKGVITAFVDDGLDYTSDDLANNFYAYGSYDFNDHVNLPTPVLFDDHHGTRCAGQVAAVKNDACGVGIAYESKVAGIRILSGPISDVDEAAALNYDYQNNSIFSCSWGPPDDGRSMEGPGYLIKKAMVNGVQEGRGGKGSVFVFASGNGGRQGDQCNFDGYTNSIFSVTVAAIDFKGLHPDYSEACAANMIVAYTSGSGNHITTTDRGKNKCSSSHGGTSAAAPNAAGVFALALEARPDLSWRDVQHLCVRTALQVNPDDPDWEMTAAGRPYSYKYGYGSLSGIEFVKASQTWKTVKPQTWIDLPVIQVNNGTLDKHNFEGLEHITVRVWITHTRRGDVEVELVSPKGVKSILAARRNGDSADTGYPGWTFMTSLMHPRRDESPLGDWTIRVSDQRKEDQSGVFLGWTLSIWGSVADEVKSHKSYVVPTDEHDEILPPPPKTVADHDHATTTTGTAQSTEVLATTTATNTKTLVRPTEHLPTDHGHSEGENTKPAFTSDKAVATGAQDLETSPSASVTPTPDEGWLAGLFFWRRAVLRKRRANYTSLRGDDEVAMGSVTRSSTGGRTKELYDAFGEVSDDDEVDEETALRPHSISPPLPTGLHTGFLDDDDPPTAGSQRATRYRDEPESPVGSREGDRSESPASGSGSGSGSSWEHASETRP
ncbi:peptidase S8/S53 domain-containing protein [Epithele typhae]|uniref:peptidase S8/S53 domain-containing protein n=1 Tax=Epithele typhae TaxID=378194 RepID=UPI002007664E|nr:peptidase S8/S53 domain-containing protein [Epithele typhae]KAH9945793.1 peptidase S8/S53 domain-containing protein [Epithele typhae]